MTDQLTQLKKVTTVVADSGDFSLFAELKPQDATTNPSLLFAAVQMPAYQDLVDSALNGLGEDQLELALDKLAVRFGAEILKIVPGRVSTELDARLSYDTDACLKKCHELVALYEQVGVNAKERVLFKLASTWQGIQAAKQLETEGIHTNLTLLFGFPQAVACAEAGVTLISPFVGRITDFWKKEKGVDSFPPEEDPGVLSVRSIYTYYKKFDYPTIVMGASFRSKEQILALAGCDYLTISPALLQQLAKSTDPVEIRLKVADAKAANVEKASFNEAQFHAELEKDICATFKLKEGIEKFIEDTVKLEQLISKKLKK
jgi:transaldolase